MSDTINGAAINGVQRPTGTPVVSAGRRPANDSEHERGRERRVPRGRLPGKGIGRRQWLRPPQ